MPLTEDDPGMALLRRNLSVLVHALRDHTVSTVLVRYDGSHGRCRHCEVALLPSHSGAVLATQVLLQRLPADAGVACTQALEEHTSLGEALKRVTLHWVSLQQGYWQRGDGGKGIMRLHVPSGNATLDHDALHIEQFHATLSAAPS